MLCFLRTVPTLSSVFCIHLACNMLLTELYMLCEISNGLIVEAKINQSQGFSRVHFVKTILKLVS